MANQKKNMGCLGSLLYIFFLVCAIMVLVSAIGGIIAVAGAAFIFVLVVRLMFIIFKKIGQLIKKKYIEARSNGAFSFIDAIFYTFNMDNWGRKNDSEESLNEKTLITEQIELTDEERAEKETDMIMESTENISGVDIPMIEMICQQVAATSGKAENHLTDKNDLGHNQEENIENTNQSITETVIDESKPIKSKPKYTYMSDYDMERFAVECNAYVVREERKKRQEQEQQGKEQKDE